jgi:hypothetical protein
MCSSVFRFCGAANPGRSRFPAGFFCARLKGGCGQD